MNIIMIANAWKAGESNPTSKHRIALELVRKGHRVLWIDGAGMRSPDVKQSRDWGRIVKRIASAFRGARRVIGDPPGSSNGTLDVLSPLLLPFPKSAPIRTINGIMLRWFIRRWGCQQHASGMVLINYVPTLVEAMRGWKPDGMGDVRLKIYHCVDRWDAFECYDSHLMAAMDRLCCESADHVIASSLDLYERCQRINPRTIMISHGVDYEHFAQAVPRYKGPTGIIGFFGLLSEWIDQDLLVRLARELPRAKLLLVGKADVSVDALKAFPNIERPGPCRFNDLPALAATFDVGIIPFKVNALTRAVNPIKLREMLAAGCPVVSTALPEVVKVREEFKGDAIGDAIRIGETEDAFIGHVRAFIDRPLAAEQRRAISVEMQPECWSAKVDQILMLVGDKPEKNS